MTIEKEVERMYGICTPKLIEQYKKYKTDFSLCTTIEELRNMPKGNKTWWSQHTNAKKTARKNKSVE